jgi:putative addiction module component (TIGR02574 family)
MSKQELMEIALALPLTERVELAQALWQSIDDEPSPDGAAEERAAIDVAVERDLELTSGRVAGRTHEQVMEAARRAL